MTARSRGRRGTARAVELRMRAIRLLVVDLDGVLTDGRVLIDAGGRERRTLHGDDRDGVGLLTRSGMRVLALAPKVTTGVPACARFLRIPGVILGGGEGLRSVERYCRRRGLELAQVAYVGHDVLELPLLSAVGLAVVVADGAPQAQRLAHVVTARPGGAGVVREVGERLLRAQGKWASTLGERWRRWD
jgi:3-deoxy-D-manno-octulosonate 8-phosphate phosphatase (KDO 8-P phosphatase)